MELTTLTAFTVTPALLEFTAVAPETKLVPVNVAETLVPAVPLLGLFEETKPVPASIADAILAKSGTTPVPQGNG